MGTLPEKYGDICRLKALIQAASSVPKSLFKGLSKIIVKSYIKKQQQNKPETSENCSADLLLLFFYFNYLRKGYFVLL